MYGAGAGLSLNHGGHVGDNVSDRVADTPEPRPMGLRHRAESVGRAASHSGGRWLREQGYLLPVIVVLIVVVSLLESRFATTSNFQNVTSQAAPLGILAVAQMFPLLTRGLDFSQVGVMALVSVITAHAMLSFGIAVGIACGIAVGAAVGTVNGLIIARFGVSPFVVTLGMLSVTTGLALSITDGAPVLGLPQGFVNFDTGFVGPVPNSAVVMGCVFVVAALFLSRSRPGRQIYAVGGNPEAARLTGIPVGSRKVLAYALSGALTALAALILTARVASGSPNPAAGLGLEAIAAAIIGGVSLFGGEGKAFGAFLGVALLVLIGNSLNLLGVSSHIQETVTGAVIIAAVTVDSLRHRHLR